MLCQLGGVVEGARLPGTDLVVAYVDDEVIGLIPAGRPGLVLAPREHTETLPEVPERSAAILAPLRLLVEEVRSYYGVEEARIEPTSDTPAARGHVCYQVVPVPSGGGEEQADPAARSALLAATLRRHAAH